MESELDLLLGTAIDSLPKLEILFHLIRSPGGVRTAREIGAQLRRATPQVERALEELSQAELVDRFAIGTGKHVLYGCRDDRHVQELLQLLHARYQDPASRSEVLLGALGQSEQPES